MCIMKTVTASTKRFMILIMALLVTASVTAQKQQHMTFDGVPIDGKLETFIKRMVAANYKYARYDDIREKYFKGKVKFLDNMEPDWIEVDYDKKNKYVYCVTLSSYKDYGNYFKVKELLLNKYPSATYKETFYKYDVIESCQDYRVLYLTIPQIGMITMREGLGMNEEEILLLSFKDEINSKKYDTNKNTGYGMRISNRSLSSYISCVTGAFLYVDENREVKISIIDDDRRVDVCPEGMDRINILKLLNNDCGPEEKAIINAYVYSVVCEDIPKNTILVTKSRIERIQKRYKELQQQELQAQQQQQRKEMVQASILMYLISGMFSKSNSNDIPPTTNDMILNPSKYNEYYYGR